jgi:uncharacterized protein YkwD
MHPISPAPAASLHPLTPHHSSPALALSTMFRTLAVLSLAVFALATPKVATVISVADEKAYLTAHNTVRAQHNAAALVWNQTLSNAAASWAGKCVFQHSGGALGPYGENLAAGTNETPAQAVASWTSEESALTHIMIDASGLT